jgi:hypothetical protein
MHGGEQSEPLKPCRFPLAGLHRPNTYLRRVVLGFRRELEAAVLERGPIGVAEASRIHTACLALRQVARIDRILAEAGEPGTVLTHEQWLAYSDRLLRGKEAVDKALAALGIDKRDARSVWDTIYAPPAIAQAAEPAPISPSANGSYSEDPSTRQRAANASENASGKEP